ncbi:hypothetical protein [Cryptosporangium minutisporangium]|uniref:Uncharacterized protein n=1 Tax=Cryptosporangium minutisporangium TaxID=113569 RepID=A0ABP6SXC3_9ACTN
MAAPAPSTPTAADRRPVGKARRPRTDHRIPATRQRTSLSAFQNRPRRIPGRR